MDGGMLHRGFLVSSASVLIIPKNNAATNSQLWQCCCWRNTDQEGWGLPETPTTQYPGALWCRQRQHLCSAGWGVLHSDQRLSHPSGTTQCAFSSPALKRRLFQTHNVPPLLVRACGWLPAHVPSPLMATFLYLTFPDLIPSQLNALLEAPVQACTRQYLFETLFPSFPLLLTRPPSCIDH